jgi:hypothetical protein
MKNQTGLPPIWLAYANARPKQAMRSIGLSTFPTQNLSPKVLKKVMGTNNTIHRDWPSSKPVEESKGYYTLLYNLNEEWRPTWAGEMITHEDDGPETHVIRPYTIGWSDKIISHKPERCVLMSADQLHRTFDCRLAGKYTTKIVFRVKEISR